MKSIEDKKGSGRENVKKLTDIKDNKVTGPVWLEPKSEKKMNTEKRKLQRLGKNYNTSSQRVERGGI